MNIAILLLLAILAESLSLELPTTSAESFLCPDVCRCGLDSRGRIKVVCEKGDMVDPIPIRSMDPLTEVLVITAPEEKANYLTIGPIFQGLAKLEELKISHSYIPAIGKHSFWGLLSLRILNLSKNNISSIVESNFRALINLQELNLDENIIDSITSAAFRHLPGLKRLTLARNRIAGFVPRLFYGLHRLEELDLSDNPLEDLEPEVFRDVRLLRKLRCRKCDLSYINPLLLHLLPDLELLDLGDNNFHFLDKAAFSDLHRLQHLYLDSNYLTVLTGGVLNGHNFSTLSLAANRIITLDPAAFLNVSIESFNLSGNRIKKLDPNLFVPLRQSMRKLNIAANPLEAAYLCSSVIGTSVRLNLSELDISDIFLNDASFLHSNPFSYQTNLKSLNLSGTNLSDIPAELFQPLESLKQLDLSRNQLYNINESTLSTLTELASLKSVQLHDNPWHCNACVIGHFLRWMDSSSATKHIRNSCRGLKTNVKNVSSPDDGMSCPVCATPIAVAGVELPRLDHINLPTCNSPPALIDSSGLPSKVRVGITSLSNNNAIDFLDSPLYLALACGTIALITLTICAAIAVASRHAASYYTHEDKRTACIEEGEAEGLCPLASLRNDIKKDKIRKNTKSAPITNSKNNNGKEKNCLSKSIVSRGVNCNNILNVENTSIYPISIHVRQEQVLC